MADFTLDTSGEVNLAAIPNADLLPKARFGSSLRYDWPDLDPFPQGYARRVIETALAEVRVVPEREDDSIAKDGETPHHWTVFPSGDDWTPLAQFSTEAEARAYVASLARFDRLAPETLARIMEDCTAFQASEAGRRWLNNMDGRECGRDFWRARNGATATFGHGMRGGQLYDTARTFPPLTPYLGDDGKVYLREA